VEKKRVLASLLTFFFYVNARKITSLHLSTSLRVLSVLEIEEANFEVLCETSED
jgi:hypothetical protein